VALNGGDMGNGEWGVRGVGFVAVLLMRVNSTNVLDEGLRIREIGRRMNSKVKLVEIGVYRK
jgi:hypothetical protein